MTAETTQKANAGAAVPDTIANGDDNESQTAWLKQRGIDLDHRIKLTKLSHMRYQHPNLDEIHEFLSGENNVVAVLAVGSANPSNRLWYGSCQKN